MAEDIEAVRRRLRSGILPVELLKPGPDVVLRSGDRALTHIRLDQDDLIKEIEANGFHLLSKHDHIPGSQYIAVFAKQSS